MVRVLSAFEALPMQIFSANGTNGSQTVFDSLLDQIDKSGAAKLSQQTLEEIFQDVADGKLSAGQAMALIETAVQNCAKEAVTLADGDVAGLSPALLMGIFNDVAEGKLSANEGMQLVQAGAQFSQQGGISVPGDGNLLVQLFQDVASGAISAQTAAQLIGAINQDSGTAPAGYEVGNSRSGQFLLGLAHDVAGGKIDPDRAVQLVEAVQAADQTPD